MWNKLLFFLLLFSTDHSWSFWTVTSKCHESPIENELRGHCSKLQRNIIQLGRFTLEKDTSTKIQIQNHCLSLNSKEDIPQNLCHDFIKYELDNINLIKVRPHVSSEASYRGPFNDPIHSGLKSARDQCNKWWNNNSWKGENESQSTRNIVRGCEIPACSTCQSCQASNSDWSRLCSAAYDRYIEVLQAESSSPYQQTPDVNIDISN